MSQNIKIITCDSDMECEEIELWEKFGWELFSSQDIINIETFYRRYTYFVLHHSDKGTDEGFHYVKIIFKRDISRITNLEKLQYLEEEYQKELIPDKPQKLVVIWVVFGFCLFIFPGIMALRSRKSFDSEMKKWEQECARIYEKRKQIVAEAESITFNNNLDQ